VLEPGFLTGGACWGLSVGVECVQPDTRQYGRGGGAGGLVQIPALEMWPELIAEEMSFIPRNATAIIRA
jgi:hypothetical protein